MRSAVLAITCLLAGTAAAFGPHVLVDTRSSVPAGWTDMGASPRDAVVPLMFMVKNQNMDKLYSILHDVSDPDSPNYGQHLSLEELGAVIGNPEGTSTVHRFLLSHGLRMSDMTTTPNGDFVSVQVPVTLAEEMLATSFHLMYHAETDMAVHRAPEYSLPVEVAAAVDGVAHTLNLNVLSRKPVIESLALAGSGQATPSVISTYYGIQSNKASPMANNSVFETIGQSFKPSDLTKFDTTFNVPAQTVAKVIGPNDPSSCDQNPNNCVEAELDVQVITAIAQDAPNTFWSIPGSESFAAWFAAVEADPFPPSVFSISYGAPETEISAADKTKFDNEVAKMGARGVTVFVASGDDGVAGSSARGAPSQCGFNPSYPASAPSVTAVGATQGPESGSTEIACSAKTDGGITTGGGFSDFYNQPSWQSSAVSGYLSNPNANLPPSGSFNKGGRAYPDVAAMGHNYPIVVGGQQYAGSGTSASTPVLAGMITLINGALLEAGKSTVGFINPMLYKFDASVWNDITSGENNCCAGSPSTATCCDHGFTAVSGWDPLTGNGSPKFEAIKAAFMSAAGVQ